MVAVITKVGWNDEYQEIREWEEEMIDQEASLRKDSVLHWSFETLRAIEEMAADDPFGNYVVMVIPL